MLAQVMPPSEEIHVPTTTAPVPFGSTHSSETPLEASLFMKGDGNFRDCQDSPPLALARNSGAGAYPSRYMYTICVFAGSMQC